MADAVRIAIERVGGARGAAYRLDLSEAMVRHMLRMGVMSTQTEAARRRVRLLAEASGVPALALVGLMPDWEPEAETGGGKGKGRAKGGLRLAEAPPAPGPAGARAEWGTARPGRVCRPPKPNDQRVRELSITATAGADGLPPAACAA
jgi:hypothetical protein